MSLWSFQGAGAGAYVRSFKTQQRGYVEVDVILGELNSLTNLCTVPGTGTIPSKGSAPTGVKHRIP